MKPAAWTRLILSGVLALANVTIANRVSYGQQYQIDVGYAPFVTDGGQGLLSLLSLQFDQSILAIRYSQKRHVERNEPFAFEPLELRLRVWDVAALFGTRIGSHGVGLRLLAGPALVRVSRGTLDGEILGFFWSYEESIAPGLALSAFVFGRIATWFEVSLFGFADWNRAESFAGVGVALSLRSP